MGFLSILAAVFLLVACGGSGALAPVQHLGPRPAYYVVEKGDTLYSIGWRYGLPYRQLARWNGIFSPYVIYAGQKLRLMPPSGGSVDKPRQSVDIPERENRPVIRLTALPSATDAKPGAPKEASSWAGETRIIQGISWRWPTTGEVIQTFSSTEPGRKGVEIAGQLGQPIVAAADGKVVYSGMGLPLYGRLIIVKHDANFFSAYAYNRTLLSKEGDIVEGGQKIAEMGRSGANRVKLHFEIRRNGQPVDPLRYLPK